MIICGTGHRPDKLGGYTKEVAERIAEMCYGYLEKWEPLDEVEVISGGALGFDQGLAAGAILAGVPFTLALPFPGFEDRWPQSSKAYLYRLMDMAKKVHFVCEPGYAGWKMQKRNEWMVDNSNRVVSLWNGTTGGTANCIAYASKVGKPIDNLWDVWNAN